MWTTKYRVYQLYQRATFLKFFENIRLYVSIVKKFNNKLTNQTHFRYIICDGIVINHESYLTKPVIDLEKSKFIAFILQTRKLCTPIVYAVGNKYLPVSIVNLRRTGRTFKRRSQCASISKNRNFQYQSVKIHSNMINKQINKFRNEKWNRLLSMSR